jgi:T5SS/PEP-CTERM-associated repeat protein/autotransporter-associated beta strand protein
MRVFSLLLWISLAISPGISIAADYIWSNPAGGDFGASENWSPLGPPGVGDRAIIDISPTGTIDVSGEIENDQLLVDLGAATPSADVNLSLNGHTYTLHHVWTPGVDDPAVVIGDSTANTRLAVVHGTVDAYDCVIARLPSSTAELCVRGDGSSEIDARWSAFDHGITVGDSGSGTLWIDQGAVVEHGHGGAGATSDGQGSITVNDPHSLWYCTGYFSLGTRGEGNLNVGPGATARIGRCVMGENRDDPDGEFDVIGTGNAVIDGEDSTWELLSDSEVSLAVGMAGNGSVTVRNQGYLHSFGHVTVAENRFSYGEIVVESGGKVEIEQSLSLGRGDYVNDEAKAFIHVEGTGSQLLVKGRGAGDPTNPDPGDYVGLLVGKTTVSTVEVVHGGYLANDYITMVGGDNGGVGAISVITVDGMDAHLENKYRLEVGHLGDGQINIGNGGRVTVTCENADPNLPEGSKGIVEIGQNASGSIYVGGHDSNGAPSSLIAASQIKVGIEGVGYLEIVDGARVESHPNLSSTNSAAILGVYNNGPYQQGQGIVRVTDPGSIWVHEGAMNVGFYGTGILTIENGGCVESGEGIVGRHAGSTGVVSIFGENSVWRLSDSLAIGGDATTPGGFGIVDVYDFGKIEAVNAIVIWEGNLLTIDPTASVGAEFIEMSGGTLAGSGTITPDIRIASSAYIQVEETTDEIQFTSNITGAGDLVILGPGAVTISGNADYEGLTTIQEGTLQFIGGTSTLHDIVGNGTLVVGADGTPTVLSASSIQVDTLIIGDSSQAAAVPEPGIVFLLISAIPLMIWLMRKTGSGL